LTNAISKRWRERAEEVRARAAQMVDEDARRGMLSNAAGYDRMALRTEQRLREVSQPAPQSQAAIGNVRERD
jgi:hypothetical protein